MLSTHGAVDIRPDHHVTLTWVCPYCRQRNISDKDVTGRNMYQDNLEEHCGCLKCDNEIIVKLDYLED